MSFVGVCVCVCGRRALLTADDAVRRGLIGVRRVHRLGWLWFSRCCGCVACAFGYQLLWHYVQVCGLRIGVSMCVCRRACLERVHCADGLSFSAVASMVGCDGCAIVQYHPAAISAGSAAMLACCSVFMQHRLCDDGTGMAVCLTVA